MATAHPTITYKDIPGFPGYRVGDDGSVWSCLKKSTIKTHLSFRPKWRLLKPGRKPSRYCIVQLTTKPGVHCPQYVHRLILTAFVGPCPDGMQACHNDGNAANNNLSNLRWDTPRANQADREQHGTKYFGERHHALKLSVALVRKLRADRAAGMTFKKLSEKYGIGATTACKITRRLSWKQVV